jgi:glutamine amidotransferase
MIAVIDYDMGNVGSILNMLRKLGVPARLTGKPAELAEASGLILPGVGAFDQGMRNLEDRGLRDALIKLVEHQQRPILGICLGLQLMTKSSEEGKVSGFGWFDARTRRFPADLPAPLRVPHMGWNAIMPVSNNPVSPLLKGLENDARFYFVHSYYCAPSDPSIVVASTDYSGRFTAAVGRANIFATQFHPEKSHHAGLTVYKNFLKVNP